MQPISPFLKMSAMSNDLTSAQTPWLTTVQISRCLRLQGCADTCEWVAVHASNGEAACVFHSTNGPIFIYKPTETDTLYQGVLYAPGLSRSTSINTIESSDPEKTEKRPGALGRCAW